MATTEQESYSADARYVSIDIYHTHTPRRSFVCASDDRDGVYLDNKPSRSYLDRCLASYSQKSEAFEARFELDNHR